MLLFLAKRLAGLVVTLLAMIFVVFCLQSLIPADPARAMAGPMAPEATVNALRQQLGLDQPLLTQYLSFLGNLLEGDLGTSVRTRQPVTSDILQFFPASLELAALATLLGLMIAAAVAILQQAFARLWPLRLTLIAVGSAPIFLTGLLLAYLFWFMLGWLPGSGRLGERGFSGSTGLHLVDGILAGRPDVSLDALIHLLLPALTLALPMAVAVGRSLASALHQVMQQPHIRTARGLGQDTTVVILRHGLRNAASAPLSMTGLQLGLLLGNLLIVERVFAWPGLGLYMTQAFASADLPAILGVSLVFGALYIFANIVVELVQAACDPRVASALYRNNR